MYTQNYIYIYIYTHFAGPAPGTLLMFKGHVEMNTSNGPGI